MIESIFIEKPNRQVLVIDLYSSKSISNKLGKVSKKWYNLEEIMSFREQGVYLNPFLNKDFPDPDFFDVVVTQNPRDFVDYYMGAIHMRAVMLYINTLGKRYSPNDRDELRPFIESLKNKYPINGKDNL